MVVALLAFTMLASNASAYRGAAYAMYNVNNQVMNSSRYIYALRFVPDSTTTVYRFFSGFNLEGSAGVGGRNGYAHGTGGMIQARLVTVNADGTPNLNDALATETVNADSRWLQTKQAYAIPSGNELLYFNAGGVTLMGGRMYAMVYRNVDLKPSTNWFSENSPTVNAAYAGPNGTNTLDPNASGAIDNLDPREAVAWSNDGAASWVWGVHVGEGDTSGAYGGSTSTDDGTRLPWYGWQASSSATPQAPQPYYAYTMSGSYTVQIKNTTASTLELSEAGGYAPIGSSVGIVTVTNLSTGASAHTSSLGGGLTQGSLGGTVGVSPGATYQISNSDTVMLENADSFIRAIYGMTSSSPIQTVGNGPSRADLFAIASASSSIANPSSITAHSASYAKAFHHCCGRASHVKRSHRRSKTKFSERMKLNPRR